MDLASPAEEFPDEVWPAIYTSRSAAQLGKYYYIQPNPGTNELKLVDDDPRRLNGEQFWVTLSRAGKRCAVLDVPKTGLAASIHGIQVANWGAHATRCDSASHPPELIDRVRRDFGEYPLHTCDMHGRKPREYAELRDLLVEGVRQRQQAYTRLLAEDDYDLFFCGFSESHCAGHQFWHLLDPQHPEHDAANPLGVNDALRTVFVALDEAVGALVEAAGPETHVVVFSGHGMRAQYHGRDLIPDLLTMWGMGEPANVEPGSRPEVTRTIRRGLFAQIKDRVPIRWQYAVKNMLPKSIEQALICKIMGAPKLDTDQRAFYVPNNDLTGAIRVSLEGREPGGRVEADAYEPLLEFIETRFRELVNAETGEPAVEKVTRMRARYTGEHLDKLPDLTVLWSGEAPLRAVRSPGYGVVRGEHHDLRTGGHASKGFFSYRPAAGTVSGPLRQGTGKDVAPTVLHLLGVDRPSGMEGQSLVTAPVAV